MNKAGRFNPKLQNGTPNTIQLLNYTAKFF